MGARSAPPGRNRVSASSAATLCEVVLRRARSSPSPPSRGSGWARLPRAAPAARPEPRAHRAREGDHALRREAAHGERARLDAHSEVADLRLDVRRVALGAAHEPPPLDVGARRTAAGERERDEREPDHRRVARGAAVLRGTRRRLPTLPRIMAVGRRRPFQSLGTVLLACDVRQHSAPSAGSARPPSRALPPVTSSEIVMSQSFRHFKGTQSYPPRRARGKRQRRARAGASLAHNGRARHRQDAAGRGGLRGARHDALALARESTTRAQDFYVYDTVQRLYDSRFGDGDVKDIKRYIRLGPLGQAVRVRQARVLLIDESTSRPRVPERPPPRARSQRFSSRTGEEIVAKHRPVVIITRTREGAPAAFLRRACSTSSTSRSKADARHRRGAPPEAREALIDQRSDLLSDPRDARLRKRRAPASSRRIAALSWPGSTR